MGQFGGRPGNYMKTQADAVARWTVMVVGPLLGLFLILHVVIGLFFFWGLFGFLFGLVLVFICFFMPAWCAVRAKKADARGQPNARLWRVPVYGALVLWIVGGVTLKLISIENEPQPYVHKAVPTDPSAVNPLNSN